MISAKLASVLRYLDSDQPGEVANAIAMAKKIMAREGQTFGDLSRALERVGKNAQAQTTDPDIDDLVRQYREAAAREAAAAEARRQEEVRRQQAASEAAWAARRKEEERRNEPLRAEVIARYGSVRAAKAWTAEEMALREAVLPWCTFQQTPAATSFIDSIDGVAYATSLRDIPARVIEALSAALPLPASIPEAKAEMDAWRRRDRDLQLVYRRVGDCQLDLPAEIREAIVLRLFEHGMRATCISDVLMRQQHMIDEACVMPEVEAAILADLESLAASQSVHVGQQPSPPGDNPDAVQTGRAPPPPAETPEGVQKSPRMTATQRREAVQAMLADPATVSLPDREIARRVGVSPSIIGNLRRRNVRQRQGDLFGADAV